MSSRKSKHITGWFGSQFGRNIAMPFSKSRELPQSIRRMIYILPPPRSTYGEWRLSTRYSPALRSRDYKDPVLIIEIDEETENTTGNEKGIY